MNKSHQCKAISVPYLLEEYNGELNGRIIGEGNHQIKLQSIFFLGGTSEKEG